MTEKIPDRTFQMCYNRYRRIKKAKKEAWTSKDDKKIEELVEKMGKNWKKISSHFESIKIIYIARTAKQIRERYINFVRPNISHDDWTIEEDLHLINLLNKHGRKWKKIEEEMKIRTQNQIKNRYFNRILKLWKDKQEK